MRAIVKRLPADSPAPPVHDPLLSTIDALRERGRYELDSTSSNRLLSRVKLPYDGLVVPGDLVGIDSINSITAKVISVAITIKRSGTDLSVSLESEA